MQDLEREKEKKKRERQQKQLKEKQRRRKRAAMVASVLFLVVGIFGFGVYKVNSIRNREVVNASEQLSEEELKKILNVNTIYDNIFIEDIDVSGKTKREAREMVRDALGQVGEMKLFYEENEMMIPYEAVPDTYIEEAVEEAYEYAREGLLSDRHEKIEDLEAEKLVVRVKKSEEPYAKLTHKSEKQLDEFAKLVDIEAEDATLERSGGVFTVIDEVAGRKLDKLATRENIISGIKEKNDGAEAVLVSVEPALTSEEASKATSLLGSHSTNFSTNNASRTQNIRVGAEYINNTVLEPGEIFSTNNTILETTRENGYAAAATIQDGEFVDDLGGGVCQLSSTLYYATLKAELDIVERQNHGLKVGYMDWSYDATLARGYIDYRFKNSTKYPVTIEAYVNGGTLTMNIYGYEDRPANRSIQFFNEHVSTNPPAPPQEIQDSSLVAGTREIEKQERIGQQYRLYKRILIDGVVQETVHVNTSTYRTVQGIVRVGTGVGAPVEPEEPVEQPPEGAEEETEGETDGE